MEAKNKIPTESSINNNSNINNIHLNVNTKKPKRQSIKKKQEPNWYVKTIFGGIIALILSLGGYYLKKGMDSNSKARPTQITPGGETVQPNN